MIIPANDEQVEAMLAKLGVPREWIFLAPVVRENRAISEIGGLLLTWEPELGFRYVIIENDALAKGCYLYLLRHGARQFATDAEAWQAAVDEKWPGWDTCDDATRGFTKTN